MRLGLGTDISVGYRQPLFGGVPFLLDTYTGAAAAYSLRQLRTGVTNVVRVRRSSDNAEADFTAAEVADGTMTDWVNTEVVLYSSDFSSTEDLSEFNGTGAGNIDGIAGIDDVYRFTLSGGTGNHFAFKTNIHSVGKEYSITFDVYVPSTNAACDGVIFSLFGAQDIVSTNTIDQWVTLTSTYTANYANLNFYALDGASKTLDGDGDVFYLKNIVVTQTTADGHVVTWYDQSGNTGRDATQATAANQPKIVHAGTLVTDNSKPAIDFDGTDDGLVTSAISDSLTAASAFMTYKIDTVQADMNIYRCRPNATLGSAVGFVYEMATNTADSLYGANTFFEDDSGNAVGASPGDESTKQDTNQHLSTIIFQSSQLLGYTDGSLDHTMNTTRAGTPPIGTVNVNDILCIGRNFNSNDRAFNGKMQELIIYFDDQSANRTGIETNINEHYNIYP